MSKLYYPCIYKNKNFKYINISLSMKITLTIKNKLGQSIKVEREREF